MHSNKIGLIFDVSVGDESTMSRTRNHAVLAIFAMILNFRAIVA